MRGLSPTGKPVKLTRWKIRFNMAEFLYDLLRFMRQHKNYWLAPIFFVFILVGALLIATEGSVIAPFIYTLF
jgi:Family of unknown function (DUF5989)